jgi:hypothetical protein
VYSFFKVTKTSLLFRKVTKELFSAQRIMISHHLLEFFVRQTGSKVAKDPFPAQFGITGYGV